MLSSFAGSMEFLWFCMLGGDDEGGPGDFELRLERLEVLEGVRYGVSTGVGNTAEVAAEYSSSVSHSLEDMF